MIDSEPLWHVAEKSAFKRVGIDLSTKNCQETTGLRIDQVKIFLPPSVPSGIFFIKPVFQVVQHHFARLGGWDEEVATRGQVTELIIEDMEKLLSSKIEPMEGLQHALTFALEIGVKLAVASSSPMRLIQPALRHLKILDSFQVIQSAENEPFGKPHPGVYLSAAKALGVEAVNCLAIEDRFPLYLAYQKHQKNEFRSFRFA